METLDFSVENAVGWIRLTRPEIHNPLDVPLRTDLMTVLEQVRNDPAVRVLVLNGGAGAFRRSAPVSRWRSPRT
jgi:2-(1,2-epoxy-1,2-dihydrophenyl)acetyl-CoA isomerase